MQRTRRRRSSVNYALLASGALEDDVTGTHDDMDSGGTGSGRSAEPDEQDDSQNDVSSFNVTRKPRSAVTGGALRVRVRVSGAEVTQQPDQQNRHQQANHQRRRRAIADLDFGVDADESEDFVPPSHVAELGSNDVAKVPRRRRQARVVDDEEDAEEELIGDLDGDEGQGEDDVAGEADMADLAEVDTEVEGKKGNMDSLKDAKQPSRSVSAPLPSPSTPTKRCHLEKAITMPRPHQQRKTLPISTTLNGVNGSGATVLNRSSGALAAPASAVSSCKVASSSVQSRILKRMGVKVTPMGCSRLQQKQQLPLHQQMQKEPLFQHKQQSQQQQQNPQKLSTQQKQQQQTRRPQPEQQLQKQQLCQKQQQQQQQQHTSQEFLKPGRQTADRCVLNSMSSRVNPSMRQVAGVAAAGKGVGPHYSLISLPKGWRPSDGAAALAVQSGGAREAGGGEAAVQSRAADVNSRMRGEQPQRDHAQELTSEGCGSEMEVGGRGLTSRVEPGAGDSHTPPLASDRPDEKSEKGVQHGKGDWHDAQQQDEKQQLVKMKVADESESGEQEQGQQDGLELETPSVLRILKQGDRPQLTGTKLQVQKLATNGGAAAAFAAAADDAATPAGATTQFEKKRKLSLAPVGMKSAKRFTSFIRDPLVLMTTSSNMPGRPGSGAAAAAPSTPRVSSPNPTAGSGGPVGEPADAVGGLPAVLTTASGFDGPLACPGTNLPNSCNETDAVTRCGGLVELCSSAAGSVNIDSHVPESHLLDKHAA